MNEAAGGIAAEAILLERVQRSQDALAFAEITRLYATMVYSTCLRICGNSQCAADATQETFFELLRNAGRVKGSLGGWLHRVATRRTIDLIRSDSARKRREREYVDLESKEPDSWAEVSPLVDQALEQLEEELRAVLIAHFLRGKTMSTIAAETGWSQPTVSRRIQQGLDELRHHLRKLGIAVTAGVLGSQLAQTTQAAPLALAEQLGKMAMLGSGTAAHSSLIVPTALKFAAAAAAVLVGAAGYGLLHSFPSKTDNAAPATVQANAAKVDQPPPPPPTPTQQPDRDRDVSRQTTASPPDLAPPEPSEPPASTTVGVGAPVGGGWTVIPGTGLRVGLPSPTTPAGAVWSFVAALSQSPEQLRATFVPGAPEAESLARLLNSPQTEEQQRLAHCLKSIGIPVRIVQTNATPDGLLVRWEARVHTEFTESYSTEGRTPVTWHVDDWFPMETRVREVDGKWKVVEL